jgi:hypothetical protein
MPLTTTDKRALLNVFLFHIRYLHILYTVNETPWQVRNEKENFIFGGGGLFGQGLRLGRVKIQCRH